MNIYAYVAQCCRLCEGLKKPWQNTPQGASASNGQKGEKPLHEQSAKQFEIDMNGAD
jgi:hypothetical protein